MPGITELRGRQALAQEQAVFERSQTEREAIFRLRHAMGWATFAIVVVSVVAALFEPTTLAALGPASGLAVWNWRRLLLRESDIPRPTTQPTEEAQTRRGSDESDGEEI